MRGAIDGLNETARALRHDLTPAEGVLWQALRGRKLSELKFRRQYPVGKFILDLSEFGYNVLRFKNKEVFENLPGVLERIRQEALTPDPSPHAGRGEQQVRDAAQPANEVALGPSVSSCAASRVATAEMSPGSAIVLL